MLPIYGSLDSPALVSLDLDALSQNEAPGVSVPNASGMSREAWLWAAEAAGRSPTVTPTD